MILSTASVPSSKLVGADVSVGAGRCDCMRREASG